MTNELVRCARCLQFHSDNQPCLMPGQMTDEQVRLLQVADIKLEIAASALQRFVATGSVDSYRQLAAIELEVRHALAAVRDLRRGATS